MTREQELFLKKNVKGLYCKELTDLLNKKFGTNYSYNYIANVKKRLGIKSGINTKFKKGMVPHNLRPIGYEFVYEANGYTYIKTDENTWKMKHRYLWEKYHGEVPEGYCVAFADQDKTNFKKENLILIEIKEKLIMKNLKLFGNKKELTKTGYLIAKLISKTSSCKKQLPKVDKRKKLSDEDVLYIRTNYKAYDKKFNGAELAKKFNISPNTIYGIISRRIRKINNK